MGAIATIDITNTLTRTRVSKDSLSLSIVAFFIKMEGKPSI